MRHGPSQCMSWGKNVIEAERVEGCGGIISFGVLRLRLAQKDAPDFAQDDTVVGVRRSTALGDFRNRLKPGKVQQAGLRVGRDARDTTGVA